MTAVPRWSLTCLLLATLFIGGSSAMRADAQRANAPAARVLPNDNRQPAGDLAAGTLKIALRAARGDWQPEGPDGPTLRIDALGEVGKPLMVPAPLIRVTEGTVIAVSLHNDLESTLTVRGLCTRGGAACAPIQVPSGESRDVRFESGTAGTYHYWASSLDAPIPFRELAGAFIVDRPGKPVDDDRILVITEWSDLTGEQLRQILGSDSPTETFIALKPRVTFVINGLSWPATERLAYELGQRVRWRVINLSSQVHPLHLHGFYFSVDSLGDGVRDKVFDDANRSRVVTQVLPPSGTMMMTWTPERTGNWLFHCHVMHHVSLDRRLGTSGDHSHSSTTHESHGAGTSAAAGMAGMVLGVTVRESTPPSQPIPESTGAGSGAAARKLTLVMRGIEQAGGVAKTGFVLKEDGAPSAVDALVSPGPPIVLRRNQPVEITLVNRLAEATSMHWHGMELESYYDGVHAFSGSGRRVTPMIAPGGSFVVRFTPPTAGTFIYHTHLHDYRQLSSGLYGPLIVLNEDETFDPVLDHAIVLGRSGLSSEEASVLTDPASAVINGQRAPRLVWKAGARHRVRLINITPDDIFSVTLQAGDAPAEWKLLAKDGATVPDARASTARQSIAVGETYDFEFIAPPGRKTLWLEVRTQGGKWQAQAQVLVR